MSALKTLSEAVSQITQVQIDLVTIKTNEAKEERIRRTDVEKALENANLNLKEKEAFVEILQQNAIQMGPTLRYQQERIAGLTETIDKLNSSIEVLRAENERLKPLEALAGAVIARSIQANLPAQAVGDADIESENDQPPT